MKKRRVLALLLALSLAVSTNGMTVFATEPGELTAPAVSLAEESTEDVQDEAEQTDAAADDADEEQDIDSEDTGKSDEEVGEDSDVSGEKDSDEQNSDIEDAGGETVSDNDLPDEEPAAEESEGLPEAVKNEVRMMTFTDDTGLKITYDANAAENNADKVTITDAGVLTESAEDIAGVVDLRDKNITEIANNAFASRTKITYVMLPKSVTKIGTGAFEDCSALKGISIPSRLTAVGDNAFKNCKALTQLALPNSVTSIGASAFQDDSRLFMVHMVGAKYSKLTTIGNSAFEGCTSLELFCSDENYNLPQSLTSIGERAFYDCRKITSVIMGDEIETLGNAVYQNCLGIREILISSKLEVIPSYAFANCSGLADIKFSSEGVDPVMTTIEGNAFSKCTRLGCVELPDKIKSVKRDAFAECTSLKRVVVNWDYMELENGALPSTNEDLCLIVGKNSRARNYGGGGVRIILSNDSNSAAGYYTYAAQLSGEGTNTNQIRVKVTNEKNVNGKDINTIKTGNSYGVQEGTICYVVVDLGTLGSTVRVVPGSVKCNGEPIKSKDGFYTFTMPVGGAAIEIEFENTPTVETFITGNKDSIVGRLSADVNYDFQKNTGYLKVGQSTKFYLTNNYSGTEERIPVSKVTYKQSQYSANGVVSIAADGTIKALKKGTAMVEGTVKTKIGTLTENVTVSLSIVVEDTGIDHISMLLSDYDANSLEPQKDEKGFIGVAVPTAKLTDKKTCTFQLEAVAFASEENDEPMAVPFTWATSDAKVAKLAKTSTSAASSVNTITVPTDNAGGGEATITVSAKDANGNKVFQKFVVTVMNYDPRLTAAQITINPNQMDGATKIGVISAYGKQIDTTKAIKAYDAKTGSEISGFNFKYVSQSGSVYTYEVTAIPGMQQLTYKTNIKVALKDSAVSEIPLTIVVKESLPNPSVSFNNKAPKINLFYANDGTPIEPIVSKLGDAVVIGYALEPLTKAGDKGYKEEDALFLKNFEIDSTTGVIRQKAPKLAVYTSNKKPVVSGYLVLKFKDYRPEATKRYKITIPTQTTVPTYVLDRTTDTFSDSLPPDYTVSLQLLDKKTKKPIEWDDSWKGDDVLTVETNSTCDAEPEIVAVDGEVDGKATQVVNIRVTLQQGMSGGKLNMKLVNKKWAEGKSAKFTYTIKLDKNFRKLSLQKSTITLNANYPEKAEEFKLLSNQRDTVLKGEEQRFEPQATVRNQAQYDLLDVNCQGGEGTAAFDLDGHDKNEIKAGSYKYVYTYRDELTGKDKTVALTVKVVKTEPTVTLKGSNVFNLNAYKQEGGSTEYVETSEMTVMAKNLPDNPKYIETSSTPDVPEGENGSDIGETEGTQSSRQTVQSPNPEYYSFDEGKSFSDENIKFTTRGFTEENVSDYFDFEWVEGDKSTEGSIKISLKKSMPLKTYTLKMMPYYSNNTNEIHPKNQVSFNITICKKDITVKLTAKGKINLLDRGSECTEKNGIHYTPVFSNLKDTLYEVVLLDASNGLPRITQKDKISDLFETVISPDGKSFFVVPKDDAKLKNNQNYELRVWIKTDGYTFPGNEGGIYPASTIKVKTAQILPKVKTDKTAVDLYLSSKDYSTSFLVQKSDENAIGTITDIAFGEKDDKADESFELDCDTQEDGSLLVHLNLKNGVSYGCNSTNKIKMYIKFKGQGDNTEGTAITMNVKINK